MSYLQGYFDRALASWSSSGSMPPQNDLLGLVFEVFSERNIEFIRAPYAALAQLAYMDKSVRNAALHAVYANSDILLYDVDRVITNIDFERSTFRWIEKRIILQDLAITDAQFLDMCLLAGFDYISTFPPLLEYSSGGGFSFKSAIDMVKTHRSGYMAVVNHMQNPSVARMNYLEMFSRVNCIIRHHIVFKDEGIFAPLNQEFAPNDLHELIGYKLPEEVYFYMMHGLVGPQVLNTLVTGALLENAPNCNGESIEYREFIKSSHMQKLRSLSLALLSNRLHSHYSGKKVSTVYWFDPDSPNLLDHEPAKSGVSINTWTVGEEPLKKELSKSGMKNANLMFCLTVLNTNAEFAASTLKEPTDKSKKLVSTDQITFVALCKCLQLRGFINSNTHQLTSLGKSILVALNPKKNVTSEESPINRHSFIEEALNAAELMRASAITNLPFNPSYDLALGADSQGPEGHILLISRVCCLLPVESKSIPFGGPLSRDLLAFLSFSKASSRSLRNLYEMSVLSLFLDDKEPVGPILNGTPGSNQQNGREDYYKISQILPQFKDTNTIAGAVINLYLRYCIENPQCQKQDAIAYLEQIFSAWLIDVWKTVQMSLVFWRIVVAISKNVGKNQIFEEANEWLKSEQAKIAIGLAFNSS